MLGCLNFRKDNFVDSKRHQTIEVSGCSVVNFPGRATVLTVKGIILLGFRFLGCILSRLLIVPYRILDLFATHTKRVPKWFLFLAPKMDLEKQEISSKSRQKEDACGAPEPGAPTLATGLLLTTFFR